MWLELVVTASRQETPLRDLPASALVVREPQLTRPDAKNFLDVFSDQPGIKVTSRQDGGIFGAGIEVRGFNGVRNGSAFMAPPRTFGFSVSGEF